MIPIRRLRIKLIAFIMLETVIVIIVINMCLTSSKENGIQSESTDTPTRDYVLKLEPEQKHDVLTKPTNKTRKIRQLRIFKENKDTVDIEGHKCVRLRTLDGSTPICVYPREVDNMISAYVTDFHTWEEDWLNATGEILTKHKDFVYLDLGCNIGVYSLFAAKLGANVFAVDPNINNLRLLAKSLRLGHLHDNVTLILNAISDAHDNVTLEIVKGNVGGSVIKALDKIQKSDSENMVRSVDTENIVETVTLDDFGDILKDEKVFIKMDIESYELNAIEGAHSFFQKVDVRYIQMEWTHFRYNEKGQKISTILIKHGLFPFSNTDGKIPLHPDRYYAWPENIVWIKR